MTPPVRPEPDDPVAAYKREYLSPHPDTSGDPVAEYKAQYMPKQKGVLSRAGDQIAGLFQSLVHNPVGTVASVAGAPIKSGFDAAIAPEVGERRPDPRLSKGGNSSMLGNKDPMPDLGSYDAEHGAVTGKQRAVATGQTFANILFPGIASKAAGGFAKLGASRAVANVGGLAAAGGAAGAAYSPDDPLAGAISGATLAPIVAGVAKGAGKAVGAVASKAVDFSGRPGETRPLIKAGPVELGTVEGLPERAARENAAGFDRRGIDAGQLLGLDVAPESPLAAVDLAGVAGQRMARGLKTSSAPAEAELRGALQPRAEGAVERVIERAKQLTGIRRADAFETHEALKARTIADGDKAYGKVWGDNQGGAITDPAQIKQIDALKAKPDGERAWAIAQRMMANDGIGAGGGAPPPGFSPEQWAMVQQAAQKSGVPIPGSAAPVTLQQLHYWKLALDDLKEPGLNRGPGEGGIGYNMGKSIHGIQKKLLAVMDDASPNYGKAREQYADNKAVENSSKLGQEHWTRDPSESAALLKEMNPAEQQVYRDQAFSRWADRVENGPADVGKGQSKPLNQKRLRLLFPDDGASFEKFKAGLKDEAQMHASGRAVLEGSNTADKIADMADMAGVALPDVFRAMRGNPLPLVARGAKALLADKMRANSDALAVERARQLSAGANGDAAARLLALKEIANAQRKRVPAGPGSFSALLAPKDRRRQP